MCNNLKSSCEEFYYSYLLNAYGTTGTTGDHVEARLAGINVIVGR